MYNKKSTGLSSHLSKIRYLIRSLSSLLKDVKKPHTKVKSSDLSIMRDNNVMPRHKLSSDWLETHVT